MTKRTAAKYKIDRRMGENIWGRAKSPVNRREYGPGQHGQRRKGKLSDFGLQLRAKQKLKGYYGDLTEKQFRRIYGEAERVKGDTGENLIGLLERRLDAVVYRAKFVPTVFAARQFVNHGHVTVNGQKVNIPSYRVKEGDVIEVRQKSSSWNSSLWQHNCQSAMCLTTWMLITPKWWPLSHAPRHSATCHILWQWNQTSWSNSTPRTNRSGLLRIIGRHLGAALLRYWRA